MLKHYAVKVISIALLLLLLLNACSAPERESEFTTWRPKIGELAVRYFYLESKDKSGDAILVTAPDGKNILLDAGIPEAGPKLDEMLRTLGVDELDIVINTHPHIDHIGGLTTLLRTLPVQSYYSNGIPHTTDTYSKVQSALKEKGIQEQHLQEGDRLELSDDLHIEILNPEAGSGELAVEKRSTEEHNNKSMVLLMVYKDTRILFTGDIYKTAEYELMKRYGEHLKADLMHAPHHGDITSSSGKFIDTVGAEHVIISANILQSLDVMKRYEDKVDHVWNTGINGNMLFISDGVHIQAFPESINTDK
ncbi:ComEC/Rec2 family competence protein [Paenibacillus lemnae]|uniref:MBL fold metallo-hydrolase n=1 Tax=Paenibacillus lemnae TaxID=1330551 RepID=A0A848MD75_PAELE|nr:MBL fold metallo-hydrolase [Paenibacillus lemnae]NMO97384.1 MBL fold metallo-hydrolase [Paenibacillus lemnae]